MPDGVTSETRFAFESFLPLWVVVALGVLLLGFSWWLARRDARFVDKPRMAFLLLLFRCGAILVLLWMLAGPTLVTTVRKLKTKSVAIFVDTSASMGLVDTVDGSGNVSRWAAARNADRTGAELRLLDQGVATLRAAQQQLTRFSKTPAGDKQLAQAKALLAQSAASIAAGLDLLRKSAEDLPAAESEIKRGLMTALEDLEAKVLEVVRDKSAQFNRGKERAALNSDQWFSRCADAFAGCIEQIDRLIDEHARRSESVSNIPANDPAAIDSGLSRLDKVESWLASAEGTWLKTVREKAVVTRYEFGDRVVPLASGEWTARDKASTNSRTLGATTQLGLPLQQIALDSTHRAADVAILITDGGHNLGQDPRQVALSLDATMLHIVPIGNTKLQRDVVLHHTHVPKATFLNDNVVVDSIVTAYDCTRETLQVELLVDDVVVDRQSLNVTSEMFDGRVRLNWKAASLGRHTLSCQVRPVDRERALENNSAKADVHVMEDKIRVLIADNFPRWEYRYLVNLFKRDERVEFDQLLFEPQAATTTGAPKPLPTFPSSLDDWDRYRVVILGDLLPSQLTRRHQELVQEYVTQRGGNVIVVAGRESMPDAFADQPLASLLPVQRGDRAVSANPYYLHVSGEGAETVATQLSDTPETSEQVWREMSQRLPIYGLSEYSQPKPTGHPLIWASMNRATSSGVESFSRAFLTWQYVGRGRVVYLAAPVTYQLRYRRGDSYHHRFWGQLLRWVVARDLAEGSRTVRLSTDKTRYEQGDAVQAILRLNQLDGGAVSGAEARVMALHEGKVIQEGSLQEDPTRPGTYTGILEGLPGGIVNLRVAGTQIATLLAAENYRRPVESTLQIDPSGALELRHPLCNLPLLRQVAEASGGMVVPPTGLDAALKQIDLAPQIDETVRKQPLWNRWDLFWIFIGCLALEWIGRKLLGLV